MLNRGNNAVIPDQSYFPLEEGLVELGLFLDSTLPLLVKYIEEIELFNPAYGLVKVQDRRELIVKHILDSLTPLGIISGLLESKPPETGVKRVADVGSGAGLPGIPLAVCMPDVEFTLIERMGRRAGFLRDALAVLNLPNVTVEEAEMEKIAPGAGAYDLIVFRAFRPLEPAILKGLTRLLASEGVIAAYKGRRESLKDEMADLCTALEKSKGPAIDNWEALPLEVPFLEEERHLLVIKPSVSKG